MTRIMAMAAGAALMVLGVAAPSLSSAAEQARHPHSHRAAPAAPRHQAAPRHRAAQAAPRQAVTRPGGPQQARPQRGTASYYAPRLNGRRMANGQRFDAGSNSAAHRTLPLGSTARVTNLENGRTADVKVEDRGPYAGNRVIDLSPRTARDLGMKEQGTAPVVVTPMQVPGGNERAAQP